MPSSPIFTTEQATNLNQLLKLSGSLPYSTEYLTEVPVWPLAVHALAAVFCLGCSALYHLMHVRCENTSKILIRLDYGGITVLIFGSFVPILWYTFPCDSTYGKDLLLTSRITIADAD
jgi:predicted membrane channel-forming protein YqfA (hemolysin III family)